MQQHQLIQLCVDSMKMLVNQTKSDIEKIKGMIPSLFTEIGLNMKGDGVGLSIQKIAMTSWTCKKEGISYMEPVMNECSRLVGESK